MATDAETTVVLWVVLTGVLLFVVNLADGYRKCKNAMWTILFAIALWQREAFGTFCSNVVGDDIQIIADVLLTILFAISAIALMNQVYDLVRSKKQSASERA